MRFRILFTFLFAFLLTSALAPCAQAQQMKPGLWEVSTKMQLTPEQQKLLEKTMASMKTVTANMTAAERERIEASMSSHNQASVSQACMTEADVKADRPPGNIPPSCKFDTQRNGSTMTTNFACDSPKMKGTSVFKFEGGGTAYTSEVVSEMGGTKTAMTARGRWLGADCKGMKTPAELMKK